MLKIYWPIFLYLKIFLFGVMLGNIWKKVSGLILLTLPLLTLQQATVAQREAYIGIDLGTTYSCVCIYYPDTKSYEFLSYDDPNRMTLPSTIYFTGKLDPNTGLPLYVVGHEANLLNKSKPSSENYIYGFKRIVGIDNIESNNRLAGFSKEAKYPFHRGLENGKGYYYIPIKVDGEVKAKLTPTDLSAMILGEIKKRLDQLNLKIIATSISTPVYFTSVQQDETRNAGIMAGFADPIITKEPIAACVSYVSDHFFNLDKEEKVMIFDFGGGTLDISIVEVSKEASEDGPGKYDSNIIANRFVGNNFLGGENINTLIYNHFLEIAASKGINVNAISMVEQLRLRLFVEDFKIKLCNMQTQEKKPVVHSDSFFFDNDVEVKFSLTSQKFDELCADIYAEIRKLLFDSIEGIFSDDTILAQQGNKSRPLMNSIQKIVLVGGSTRIPYIKSYFEKEFKHAKVFNEIDADKAIGQGACMACVNASPESGESSIIVLGATALNVGIKVADGSIQVIVPKNTTIPTESIMQFTTAYDNQTIVSVEVAMGVRPMFADNEPIGNFRLQLKTPQPKGVPKIDVKITYKADYSFIVTATDTETGNSESITVESNLGKPSQSKIAQMLETAKKFKLEDEEAQNRIEQFRLFTAALEMFEAQLKDAKSKANILSDLDVSYFDTILDVNKTWIEQNKATAKPSVVESKLEDLKASATELANKIKAAAAASATKEQQPVDREIEKETGREAL